MDIRDIVSWSALAVSIGSLLRMIYFMSSKFAKLELKVDTMWEFQMRRAYAEVVQHGLGKMESPLELNEKALALYENMKDELREFYNSNCTKLAEADLPLAIEKKFGDRITKEICIPENLLHGACLVLATAVAKDVKIL